MAQNNPLTLTKDQYWGGKRSTFFKSKCAFNNDVGKYPRLPK